jgi:Fe-S cluster biogenesis protein NfuA
MADKTKTLTDQVADVIERLRPMIQADDGDIELVQVTDDGVVQVRFLGECIKCPSKPMTLQTGIEQNIKAHVPQIHSVVAVD